jgi:hypothetical protein
MQGSWSASPVVRRSVQRDEALSQVPGFVRGSAALCGGLAAVEHGEFDVLEGRGVAQKVETLEDGRRNQENAGARGCAGRGIIVPRGRRGICRRWSWARLGNRGYSWTWICLSRWA